MTASETMMLCPPDSVALFDRDPLRVMFVHTSLTVGGEEVLLVEIIRRLDRAGFAPELCCLKELGPLGEMLAGEVPTFEKLLPSKFDLRVFFRLARLMRQRRIEAVVTVGTGGDKMFWGRLAAWRAGVPVIVSAIHSTGWPIRVEWCNRRLAGLTDAFIAVADHHAQHIIQHEGCPEEKVCVIPNGVDVHRFQPRPTDQKLRAELGLPADAPVAGIVAEFRHEKNHARFLRVAKMVLSQLPTTHFLIVGDGPQRDELERLAERLGIAQAVHFCGRRSDVPELLSAIDLFLLSSDMEASPVSILEAMAAAKPVVSTRVGSIPETVIDGVTGYLAQPADEAELAKRVTQLLSNSAQAAEMGRNGRERVVSGFSVERMVERYEQLIIGLYNRKCTESPLPSQPLAVVR